MAFAKKRYGQNFLKDDFVLSKIVEFIPNNSNSIVEIGAGLGDLTRHLVQLKSVISFEIDNDLIPHLNMTFKEELDSGKLILNHCDVLSVWRDNLIDGKYDLVANLPYHIGTNIVLKALSDDNCQNILVMLQKEVVDRFCAEHKTTNYSSISVLVQSVATVTKMLDVGKSSFLPPPKIDSSVVLLKKHSKRDENLEKLLKIAFSSPRKLLLKNLAKSYDKEFIESIFHKLELSLKVRAGEVSICEFKKLLNYINKG